MTTAARTAQNRFDALIVELGAIEKSLGRLPCGGEYYIVDPAVDEDNAAEAAAINSFEIDSVEYWNAAYGSACSAAGERCEGYSLNINKLIGRSIY
jgi:hypothetical protein